MRHSIIITMMSALHICWAVLVAVDPATSNATALAEFSRIPQWATVLILAGVGLCAIVPTVRMTLPRLVASACIAPQQTVLVLSAMMTCISVLSGHYPDGTIVSRAHLAADQLWTVMFAVGHFVALHRIACR